jgi:hypothetical protein
VAEAVWTELGREAFGWNEDDFQGTLQGSPRAGV